MLKKIVSEVIDCIKGGEVKDVFPAFDGTLLENKPKSVVTFIGVKNLTVDKPIFSYDNYFCPFEAEISVSVTAPQWCGAYTLYDFFSNVVIARLVDSAYIFGGIKNLSVKFDSTINRLVLSADIAVSGCETIERSYGNE